MGKQLSKEMGYRETEKGLLKKGGGEMNDHWAWVVILPLPKEGEDKSSSQQQKKKKG